MHHNTLHCQKAVQMSNVDNVDQSLTEETQHVHVTVVTAVYIQSRFQVIKKRRESLTEAVRDSQCHRGSELELG